MIQILSQRALESIDIIGMSTDQNLLPSAYVLRREGTVFSAVCLSTEGRGYPLTTGPVPDQLWVGDTTWYLVPDPFGGGGGYPSQFIGQEYPLPTPAGQDQDRKVPPTFQPLPG